MGYKHNTTGFSLIEVLVSLSLFTIVVTISVGSMVVLLDGNAKAREKKELLTQLSFMLDTMTRDIRTGYNYRCTNSSSNSDLRLDNNLVDGLDCLSGGSALAFTESGGSLTTELGADTARVAYRLDTDLNRIERGVWNSGSIDWAPVTPVEINIEQLTFYVTDTARGTDYKPPAVTIVIAGNLPSDVGDDNEFAIQTTVVQRLLDL